MSDSPPAPSVEIRPVTRVDLSQLAEFIGPFVEEGRLLPRTTDELEELVYNGFIAEVDGRLIGFAALEIYSRKLAEIRSLAVAIGRQFRVYPDISLLQLIQIWPSACGVEARGRFSLWERGAEEQHVPVRHDSKAHTYGCLARVSRRHWQ